MVRGVIHVLANKGLLFQGSAHKMTFQDARFVGCKEVVGVAAWNNFSAPRPASVWRA